MNGMKEYQSLVPYFSFAEIEYPKVLLEIKEDLDACIIKGLTGQITTLKQKFERTALACLAETKKMGVIESYQGYISVWLEWCHPDGRKTKYPDEKSYFRAHDLSAFEGNIPSEIIRSIPPTIVNKAQVFEIDERSGDPIIALPIKQICEEKPGNKLSDAMWGRKARIEREKYWYRHEHWLWLAVYQWD